jgi:hypothetical protein
MSRGWLRTVSTTIATLVIVGVLAAPPAAAHSRSATRMVVARGSCSGDSHWTLMLVKGHHRIGVGFRVVQGVEGNVWRVRISQNRHTIFRALQATHGERGSFAVRTWTRNTRGLDFFRARARNLATDEICRGRAVI